MDNIYRTIVVKIYKKIRSYSLLFAWLVILLSGFVGVVRAENIEILYEQDDGGGWLFHASDWVLSALVVFLSAWLWWIRNHYQTRLVQQGDALQRANSRLRDAQRIARIGTWSRDFTTGDSYWSEEARQVLGIVGDDDGIPHYESLIHPDDEERVTEVVAAAYFRGGAYQCDHRVLCPNGQEKYIRLAGQVFLGEASSPVHETGTVQDITARRLTELALQRSEERMRSILDAAPYPILILEITEEFPVLYANKSAYDQFGLDARMTADELRSQQFWRKPGDRDSFIELVLNEHQISDREMIMKAHAGNSFWASLTSSRLEFAGVNAVFISIMDITDRKRIQMDLERLATTDPLTGVFNRRSFFENAQREIRRAVRYQQPLAVLMMDLDRFKVVNDNYGHNFGDTVLQRFCDLVQYSLREEDVLGRLGGEEFSAILVASDEQSAYLVAERIRKRWEQEVFEVNGDQLQFSVSLGVASMENETETLQVIMERADVALYRAKRSGRNSVVLHTADNTVRPLTPGY